jgi:hypothetical protein
MDHCKKLIVITEIIREKADDLLLNSILSEANVKILIFQPENQVVLEKYGVEFLTPVDLITKRNHDNFSLTINDISHNWWQYLFPDILEPEIAGLKITELYTYEIELALSAIIFKILVIQKALDNYSPEEIVFININTSRATGVSDYIDKPMGLLDFLYTSSIYKLFVDNSGQYSSSHFNLERAVITGKSNQSSLINKLKRIINFVRKRKFVKHIRKYFLPRVPLDKIDSKTIVITGGGRCLGEFIREAGRNHSIHFLKEEFLNPHRNVLKSVSMPTPDPFNQKYVIGEISIYPIMLAMAEFCLNQMELYRDHYTYLAKLIRARNPKAYITISGADALNRINIWIFHSCGIQTFWHGDGLGQFSSNELWRVLESATWLKSPTIKLIASEYYYREFEKRLGSSESLRLTGYLAGEFNQIQSKQDMSLKRRLGVKFGQQVVVYATSLASDKVTRPYAQVGFELINEARDIVQALGGRKNIFLIIKLHPGAEKDIEFYQSISESYDNIKIIHDLPMADIIDLASIVILYSSSVGLETLNRGKHLIIYNHSGRPSSMTDNYEFMNQDPNMGPAARMVHNQSEIYPQVAKLLEHENSSVPSPGLEYLLENSKLDYNPTQIIRELLD